MAKPKSDIMQEHKKDAPKLKWEILILHNPTREHFLARLLAVLKPQLEGHPDVKIAVRDFDNTMDLGTNRQAMINASSAEFVAFVDDDDLVSDHYVSSIYPLLEDKIDYIGFQLQMFMDGEKQIPTYHSLRYPEWSGDDKGWYRDISHVNPIRRELALLVSMRGGPGEDHRWAQELRAKGVVKTEHYIDSILYFYYCRSNKGEAVTPQPQQAPAKVPLQQAKCPECGSTAVGIAGGLRRCNMCQASWS